MAPCGPTGRAGTGAAQLRLSDNDYSGSPQPTPEMSAKFCWIICSLSADDPAASAGCAPIISSLDPRSSSSTDRLRKMRKYGRAVAEIEVEAVVGGMLNRTLMQVLSVSRKRPPDKLPPGIKETADPAVTAIGAASPLLAISLRRPSSR